MSQSETSDTPTGSGLALGSGEAPTKSKMWAWALWDVGTQPFYSVITTFVFATYVVSKPFAPTEPNWPTQALTISTAIAAVFIAILAPMTGQQSERLGRTVRNLKYLTWALALVSMALVFTYPSSDFLWYGLFLVAAGTVIGELAWVNYNALIERVALPENVGRVSGFGWGMGYVGGILMLAITLFVFINPDFGPFGIADCNNAAGQFVACYGADGNFAPDVAAYTGFKLRVAMVVVGVWNIVWTAPIFVSMKDKAPSGQVEKLGVIGSYKSLFQAIAKLWRTQRHVAYFLLASALFRDGLAGIFTFGAVVAVTAFGFSTSEIIIFGMIANVVAGVVTMLVGILDDKIGPKKVILIALGILIVGTILAFAIHQPGYSLTAGQPGYDAAVSGQGKSIFWVLGLIMSAVVGPAQSAARSFLARIIPEGQMGEIFGLYTFTGRVASFLSPVLFGLFVGIGVAVMGPKVSVQHWGYLGLAICLAAGFAALLPVRSDPEALEAYTSFDPTVSEESPGEDLR
ncbi:MAG: MFS transporter [Propionibacteriaceae bacterium]|jgi:UMF1 family MFS transporter|nr:MFS transporter [Propionibacteriaceae bacterium]